MIIFIFSLIAIVAGVYVVTNWTRETQVVVQDRKPVVIKETTYYKSYCWKCGKNVVIDSRNNRLCLKCGKYYVCNKCGKCLCDKREFDIENKSKKIKTYWDLSEVKESKPIYSGNTCNICGKKLPEDKKRKLCFDCYKKVAYPKKYSDNSDGYCQKCGKKLRGDTNKKLCTACWRSR